MRNCKIINSRLYVFAAVYFSFFTLNFSLTRAQTVSEGYNKFYYPNGKISSEAQFMRVNQMGIGRTTMRTVK
jgi:hypothetical protein